jgi:uncharacterized repeat protein (TIGR01451 family)
MKRNRVMTLALGLAMLAGLLVSANAIAHPVTIDGATTDWFATSQITSPGAYPIPNTGQVARNAAQQGEFIWRDAVQDQRIAHSDILTKEVDLRSFRVTGDAVNLYLQMHVEHLTALNGPNVVEFQITIDDDTGAQAQLVDDVNATDPVSTTLASPWKYLVQTRFKNGTIAGTTSTAAPRVYTDPTSFSTSGTSGVLKAAGIDTAELKIPWSLIGGAPPAVGKHLRFTVATMYSDRAVPSTADGVPHSRVMDTMHPTLGAVTDLQGDFISYFVDMYFDVGGEVFSPLLITEFQPNAVGADNNSAQDTEWIEIYNASALTINLGDYKVGDAAKRIPTGGEGMFRLPKVAMIDPGEIVVVANSKTRFNAVYPGVASLPNVRVYGIDTNDLTKYADWAGGNIFTLLDGPAVGATSFEEQVVLLDNRDTLVDIVTYISSVFPNSTFHPGVIPITFQGNLIPESRTYERCPATRDTNDASFDFIAHNGKAAQTPGALCDGKTALSIAQAAPATVAVAGRIDYTLTYANSGASAADVYITDTLALNTSYVAGSQVSIPAFGSSPIVFTDLGGGKLQWKLPLVGTGSGTLSFSAQVAGGVPPGQALANSAVIAGRLPDTSAADNTSTASTTVTANALADVGIAKALISSPEMFYTGRPATYTLTYSNSGDLPAMHTLITDTIPAGLAFVSASQPPAIVDSGKLVFDVGTVSNAVNKTIVLTFTVTASTAGDTISNGAAISTSTTPEPVKGNNSASTSNITVAVPPIDLALSKTADVSAAQIGSQIGYTLTINNIGGGTAGSIQVVDTLPDGLTYKPGSSSAAAGEPVISGDGRTLTWNLPGGFTISTGATRSFQFTTIASKASPGSGIVNSAVVHAAADTNTQNDSASSDPTTVSGTHVYLAMIVR